VVLAVVEVGREELVFLGDQAAHEERVLYVGGHAAYRARKLRRIDTLPRGDCAEGSGEEGSFDLGIEIVVGEHVRDQVGSHPCDKRGASLLEERTDRRADACVNRPYHYPLTPHNCL